MKKIAAPVASAIAMDISGRCCLSVMARKVPIKPTEMILTMSITIAPIPFFGYCFLQNFNFSALSALICDSKAATFRLNKFKFS